MDIQVKDLNDDILNKLNRFDNIVEKYGDIPQDGYISYDPKIGFYFKKANTTAMRTIFSEDQIVDLEEGLYNTRKNVLSTYLGTLVPDAYNAKIKNCPIPAKFKLLSENVNNESRFFGFDSTLINSFVEDISANFNIAKYLKSYNIINVELYNNYYYIVTDNFGVYTRYIDSKEYKLISNTQNIKASIVDHRGELFLASEECVERITMEGECIEKYYNIANAHQIPDFIFKTESDIFIVGKSIGLHNYDNLIHGWTLDSEGINYNIIDSRIQKNPMDDRYQILYSQFDENSDDDKLYLCGTFGNEIFVWILDLIDLTISEKRFSCISNDIKGFVYYGDFAIFATNKMIYVVNTKDDFVVQRFTSSKSIDRMYEDGNLVKVISKELYELNLPSPIDVEETIEFVISDKVCNNIYIYIKNYNNEELTLKDENDNKLNISSQILFENDTVIKLLNCKSNKIKLLIKLNDKSCIEGISVKQDKIFLR